MNAPPPHYSLNQQLCTIQTINTNPSTPHLPWYLNHTQSPKLKNKKKRVFAKTSFSFHGRMQKRKIQKNTTNGKKENTISQAQTPYLVYHPYQVSQHH